MVLDNIKGYNERSAYLNGKKLMRKNILWINFTINYPESPVVFDNAECSGQA